METNNENQAPKRRALGRGLEELFYNEPINYEKVEEKIINETPKEEIVNVKLDELRSNPYQPRKIFDEEALNELAASIKEHGVFQPIIVKKSIKGYEIIAGERRVKASKLAGKKEIPAIIRNFDDTQMMEIALLENLQRENLSAIEESMAYKKLQDTLGLTQEQLAERLGKSRSHITNMLGLLNLPESIQEELANKVIEDGLSVRELENLTQEKEQYIRTHKINKTYKPNNEYKYIQEDLCEKLGTKVKIKNNKIEISFVNGNDLNRILEIMKVENRG